MKSAIALCFLAVFCTANATLLDIYRSRIRIKKRTVESTIRRVERIRDNVDQDVELTVMEKRYKQIKEYNNYADPILDTIHKEVEDAKARGKNAQVCYDYALHTFENIINIATTDAGQCQESAKNSIRKKLHFINHLITTGCDLIEELDNIFPNCYKTNSRLTISDRKLYSCVKNQFGISKASVKKLKTDARSVKSTAKSASKSVVQEATNCLNNVYTTARSKVPEARSVATRCLEYV